MSVEDIWKEYNPTKATKGDLEPFIAPILQLCSRFGEVSIRDVSECLALDKEKTRKIMYTLTMREGILERILTGKRAMVFRRKEL